jgi:sn-glycerol 3-phosphate transport system permease protein
MQFYTNMIPLFALTVIAGALFVAYRYQRIRRSIALGALVGAVAGFLGPTLFMLPLQACTFEPERTPIDYAVGAAIFIFGALIAIYGVAWGSRYMLARGKEREALTVGQTTHGVFNTSFIVPFVLLAPTLLILIVFIYYPAVETFNLATRLVRLGAPRTAFRCVDNFTELIEPTFSFEFYFLLAAAVILTGVIYYVNRFGDARAEWFKWVRNLASAAYLALAYVFLMDLWEEDYAEIFFNTVFISVMIVVVGLVVSLAIAYLAYQPVKGATIYRTLLIWPYAVSPAIAGILFSIMFDPNAGIVDHLLEVIFGVDLPAFRQDAWLARWVIIIASVWKTLGYNILFYLAGLQNVPKDLIEAAAIDGANVWQRFANVVLPSLSPITFFLIITNLTYAFFSIFGTIDYLTKGAPAGATSVAIYEIYRVGIQNKDLGRAAAQSIILFLIVIAVTLWQFRTSGRRVSYGA